MCILEREEAKVLAFGAIIFIVSGIIIYLRSE